MISKYSHIIRQLFFYGIVGIVSLAIDIGITTFLYDVAHFPAYLASAIGFLSGFFFNFPINRKKVFHHSNKDRFNLHTQVVMFLSLSIFNLIFTSAAVELIVSANLLPIVYAKMLMTCVIVLWNFLFLKLLIFSKKSS